jgi:Fe-S oxidoreductase
LSEFLAKRAPDYVGARNGRKLLVHMHCHHRAIFSTKEEVALLNATGGEVRVLDSGCCGMAGPYGFERKSYDVSQALADRVLLPAVRGAQPDTVVVADGFSCREQIVQNTQRQAVHIAEVLAGRI